MKRQVVSDIVPNDHMSVDELIRTFAAAGGFSAKNVSDGVDILEAMCSDTDCFRFLSFPACIMATGTRGVVRELVKRRLFDAVITTAGTLDHDLARLWKPYYQGTFMADDRSLHKQGINRLGNVFIPTAHYGTVLERKLRPMIDRLYKQKEKWSTRDLIWECGRQLDQDKNKEDSVIYWAWKNKIPVYVPGITDGSFGSQLWMYYQEHRNLTIDLFADEQGLADLVFSAPQTGALIVGGGISKHHTIWWNQFKGGLSYAVYITTAVEWDGSLSGAQTREAISWGKVSEKARNVTIDGDATVLLPLMVSSLLQRRRKKRQVVKKIAPRI